MKKHWMQSKTKVSNPTQLVYRPKEKRVAKKHVVREAALQLQQLFKLDLICASATSATAVNQTCASGSEVPTFIVPNAKASTC